MLASWTTIHRIGPNRTAVINELTDESFITDQGEAYIQFITSLHENVNPYYIPAGYTIKERFAILNELSAHLLLREDRWLSKSLDSVMYSCYIPKTHQSSKRLFSVLNTLLYLLFLPALIGGLVRFFSSGTELHSLSIPGIACGILLGIVLHEAAHAVAATYLKLRRQLHLRPHFDAVGDVGVVASLLDAIGVVVGIPHSHTDRLAVGQDDGHFLRGVPSRQSCRCRNGRRCGTGAGGQAAVQGEELG